MSYITEAQLLGYREQLEFSSYKSLTKATADITIFLSHSHKDKNLVLGLIEALAKFRIKVYVDWQDNVMPRITNRATAQLIKERIKGLDLFFILATKNAMESKWVPWEIGYADSVKRQDNIVIIPVIDASGTFTGNEYLQLYQKIYLLENSWMISQPSEVQGSIVSNWLRSVQLRKIR